jgi:hypothetical protein
MLFKRKHEETPGDEGASGAAAQPAGVTIDGVILHYEASATRRTRSRLTVGVKFEDGQTAEFTEEIVDFYQPPRHSPEAQQLMALGGGQQTSDADAAEVLSHMPGFARGLVRDAVEQNEVPVIPLDIYESAIVPVRYDPAHRTKLAIDETALHQQAFDAYLRREQAQRAQAWDKLNKPPT